jgi:hypothetical protein
MSAVPALDRNDQLELVAEAGRAPSAHNTQPARWRFEADGRVVLLEDVHSRLPVADPDGRDAAIGLGAAFEAMRIVLSKRGLDLGAPERAADRPDLQGPFERYVPVVVAALRPAADIDPLAKFLHERRTWRGRFGPSTSQTRLRLREVAEAFPGAIVIVDEAEIAVIAGMHDAAAYRFLRKPEYQRELYGWMRFTDSDPAWSRNGLTADCIGLSPFAGRIARALLRPRSFGLLQSIGLARPLMSERGATRSATGLIILCRPATEGRFDGGRVLHRLWLALTAAGVSACPMSALNDDVESRTWLRERYSIPADSWIVTVLRTGPHPAAPIPVSPRLRADELLV